jgi:hypothetical protein
MTLPNYYLADLPPEAVLTPEMIREACITLKRNRARYLATWNTSAIVRLLANVAEDWLQETNPFRRMALEAAEAQTGFSPAVLAAGLDTFFQQLTVDNLETLLLQELGHVERFDTFVASQPEQHTRRAALVRGPELLVHFTAGNLPNPALHSMILGLLARSAQFVKCAQGQSLLPRLFAHSIYEVEPKIGSCLEVAAWPGGNLALEQALFQQADCLTVTGSDETLDAIRQRLPSHVRFLGYGHRVSFAYIVRDMLSRHLARELASQAAWDVAAWDQLGCLSPHVVYVQREGAVAPETFAELLAEALNQLEQRAPRGPRSVEQTAAISTRRAFYEVRAAYSPETRQWCSPGSTAWTVVFESDPQFQVSCLNRFVYVKPVRDLDEALQAAAPLRGKVSTVGLAAPLSQAEKLARRLAEWGVARVCRLGQMQNPPLLWRHDGRPSLGDLVLWTDWEK